jgi:hypothetical protein
MAFAKVFRGRPRNAQMPPKGAEQRGDAKLYAGSGAFAPRSPPTILMAVIPITLAISLGLVLVFVAFFLREHRRGRRGGAERDSLMPLAEETRRPVPLPDRSGHRAPRRG